jgi:hypothetical protein
MMTNRRPLFGVVLGSLLTVAVLFSAGHAGAAGTPISLTTSPIALDLTTQPGTTVTKTLQLKNDSSQPLQINMQVQLFGPAGTSGQAAISAPRPGDASTSWVHLSPASFIAQPGAWSSVQMTLALPKTAQLGYYYAVIFKPTLAVQSGVTSVIKGSNAILVLVDTHSSNEDRQVQVANFSTSKHLYEYLPATFNVSIHNGGNIYLPASGNIFISRSPKQSNNLATLTINGGGGNILPNSNRDFTAVWNDGFPSYQTKTVNGKPVTNSKGQPEQHLVWDFSKVNHLRIGKYYAQLALVYNNGQRPVLATSTVSFWVLPWKIMIVLLLILALIGFGLFSLGRGIYRQIKRARRH